MDERPYRALPFTAARVLSVFHRCDGGAEFRKGHSKKTQMFSPTLTEGASKRVTVAHARPVSSGIAT